ncbi:MAG: hypothetical protein SCH39_12310 [Methanosarcinales archaeon]|nr:hypothetical protein [Methanosarcinales archaeon]
MKKILETIVMVGTILMVLGTMQTAAAIPPDSVTGEMFMCPSVSINNPGGMWVIGGHGAYYIILPASNSPNWNTMEHLNPFAAVENNPADVEGKAQVNAGKGLYGKFPTYPYFQGMAMVLDPDGVDFIKNTFNVDVSPGAIIINPSDVVSYTQAEEETPQILNANVPLFSAAFW